MGDLLNKAARIVIARKKAAPLVRIHLSPSYMTVHKIKNQRTINLDHDRRCSETLSNLLSRDNLLDLAGRQEGVLIRLKLFYSGEKYLRATIHGEGILSLEGNWENIFRAYEIEKNALITLWYYAKKPKSPKFVIYLDGYAEVGEELPMLSKGIGDHSMGLEVPVFTTAGVLPTMNIFGD